MMNLKDHTTLHFMNSTSPLANNGREYWLKFNLPSDSEYKVISAYIHSEETYPKDGSPTFDIQVTVALSGPGVQPLPYFDLDSITINTDPNVDQQLNIKIVGEDAPTSGGGIIKSKTATEDTKPGVVPQS
ncbi:MAG: hypothetical protein ACFB10_24250 [Salibacteraceae bacterium]